MSKETKRQVQSLREAHAEVKKGAASLYQFIQEGEFEALAEKAAEMKATLTEVEQTAGSLAILGDLSQVVDEDETDSEDDAVESEEVETI